MAPSSDGFPVNMCPAHSKIVAYKHGQNAANALENTIFTAAAGDLPAYQQIFRRIYLDLKTQSVLVLCWKRFLSEETQESKYK
jgi:hypothetical protein